MYLETIKRELADRFTESRITSDFHRYYAEQGLLKDGLLEFEVDGQEYRLAPDTKLEIICRVVQIDYAPTCEEVRVVAAVGGVKREHCGFVEAHLFLVKMFYQETNELCSIDYSSTTWDL